MIRKKTGGSVRFRLGFIFSLVFLFTLFAQAEILNEWGFSSDPAGRVLSQANNLGSEGIAFTAGNESALATDGTNVLVCTHDDLGTSGMWTNGAVLDAATPSTVSNSVQYLRCDLTYDLSDTNSLNDSGGVVGFAFYDNSGNQVAGVALAKDVGAGASPSYTNTWVTDVLEAGTITMIAKVDLTNQTMEVWYDLTGDVSGFSESSSMAQKSILITSFDSLRFHATGDIQPSNSTDQVAVDLLRTADTWDSIVAPQLEIILPALRITVEEAPASMTVGESNLVTVVIHNDGRPATNVTTTLIHDGAPSDFTIVSNNAPVALGIGESVTNTYWLTGNTDGGYEFTAQAFSAETNSASTNFNLSVSSGTGRYLNEWTFETDTNGIPLNQAHNTGISRPLAQFEAGSDSTVFTTNRALLCTGEDAGTDGIWTNGAVLNAGITSATSGKHYLRYDVDYDFSSTDENDSGNVLGVYFTDSTGEQAAGLILGYDIGRLQSSAPANRPVTEVARDIPLSGSLTAIAEVDLDSNTLKVWYDLSGNNVFDENNPAGSKTISMSSINQLTFHATGDLRPDGTDDHAAVDNIRHAASWDEIAEPPADVTAPGLRVSVEAPDFVATGGSNLVRVVINNVGCSATNVTTTLSHDGAPSDFTLVSNNVPVSLESGAFHTNTYWLTANADGGYEFTAQAFSTETSSPTAHFDLWVGPRVSFTGEEVIEDSGVNEFPGLYEPGEVLWITVTNINDGAVDVTNVTNSLSANPGTFSITPLYPDPNVYPNLTVGQTAFTVYEVAISPSASHGTYTFDVQNTTADGSWTNSFTLDVFALGVPVLSPLSVDLSAAEGLPDTASVTVSNIGSSPFTFTVSDDAVWGAEYTRKARSPTWHAAYTFIPLNGTSPETDGISDVIDLEFLFPFYGQNYSGFYVTSDGVIGLSNSTNAPALGNGGGDLPKGSSPLIAPFWGDLRVPSSGDILYSANEDRVVISWLGVDEIGGGTGLEFQARLYADGQIDFAYQEIPSGSPNNITVGLQGDAIHYTNLDITPDVGVDQRMTPHENRWVWYEPTPATVDPGESLDVTFRIGPNNLGTWPLAGNTQSFDARFDWSGGGFSNVAVTAEVRPVPVLRGLIYQAERMEEGETITATAIVTNFGGLATEVTTTLTHDGLPADFTIVSNNAPVSMEPNAVITNTYDLTAHTVGNYQFTARLLSAESDGEEVSYPLEVVPRTERLITPDSVALSAVEGRPDTETVTVENRGDTPFSFTVSDDADWNVEYTRNARSFSWHSAYTLIPLNGTSEETDGISDVIDLGFLFPFYGQNYSGFYVTSDGVIGLSNSTNAPALANGGGSLPKGSNPLIAPFWGALNSPVGSIKYSANEDRVVIAWVGVDEIGGGTGLEFQARLSADGQIDFAYQEISSGSPNNITVGLQGDATHYTNLNVTPIERVDQRWIPQGDERWVWYEPGGADLQPGESVDVTFRIGANRAGQWPVTGSTKDFNARFNWSSGGFSNVSVFAEVVESLPVTLSISNGFGGSVSPTSDVYNVGDEVELTATPDTYYQFDAWSGTGTNDLTTGGVADSVVTVTMNSNVSLNASFEAKTVSGGTPHWWLAEQNPDWTNDFEAAATNDVDGDGAPTDEEYVAGTSATNAQSVFAVSIDGPVVSFQTLETTEQYGDLIRYYDLERRLSLLSGLWLGVPGQTNLTGDGTIIYTNSAGSNAFFRGRVWLEE